MTTATQHAAESVVPVRLSAPELAALLAQPEAGRLSMAQERLMLTDHPAEADVPTDHRALAVGRVLRAADHWVEIGWAVDDRRHVLNIAGGAGVVLVIGRPDQDEFEFLAVNRGRPIGEAVLGVLRSLESPEMVVVNADGFGGPPSAILGVQGEQGLDLRRWDENPLPAGVVAAMTLAAAKPGPAWKSMGSGTLADLIDAVSMVAP